MFLCDHSPWPSPTLWFVDLELQVEAPTSALCGGPIVPRGRTVRMICGASLSVLGRDYAWVVTSDLMNGADRAIRSRTSDGDDVDQAVQRRKVVWVPRVERKFD